jgi:hypothetical protein
VTKVIASTALLYGRDYLASAIRSVIDAVDEYWVLYTPEGSHGHRTHVPCPETRDELHDIAYAAAGRKLKWVDGHWQTEGQQRDRILSLVPDADVILVLDADEVWSEGLALCAIQTAAQYDFGIRRWRIPIVHYWRSFHRCVLHDPAFPERMILPNAPQNDTVFYVDKHFEDWSLPILSMPIHHFGYAQRPEIVEYKQHVHGHKGEWRRDVDWFNDRFMANAQHDCHPVGSEFWQPEEVDPFAIGLPEFMRSHPYANLKVVGDGVQLREE